MEKTLQEAITETEKGRLQGIKCPCCGLFVKTYKRKISWSQVKMLKAFYVLGAGFHHSRDMGRFGRNFVEFTRLKHWEFVEKRKDAPAELRERDVKDSGYWRMTQHGIDFLFGNRAVRKYLYIFDDGVVDSGGVVVTVGDCLGVKFSYTELMAGLTPPTKPDVPQLEMNFAEATA